MRAHVSRLAKTILQAVCVRVFADTVGLGGDERGDERRWKVPGGSRRFEMVISLARARSREAYRGKLERNRRLEAVAVLLIEHDSATT